MGPPIGSEASKRSRLQNSRGKISEYFEYYNIFWLICIPTCIINNFILLCGPGSKGLSNDTMFS
jgi:hypothetical protein